MEHGIIPCSFISEFSHFAFNFIIINNKEDKDMDFIFKLLNASDIDITTMLNLNLIFGLLAIGFLIKHLKWFNKLPNDFIPVILLVVSLGVSVLNADGSTPGAYANAFISGLLSASVAIGLHQQGKGTVKSIKSALKTSVESFVDNMTDLGDDVGVDIDKGTTSSTKDADKSGS
jgi:hypothetical protein